MYVERKGVNQGEEMMSWLRIWAPGMPLDK
jgi:hypothetical protein